MSSKFVLDDFVIEAKGKPRNDMMINICWECGDYTNVVAGGNKCELEECSVILCDNHIESHESHKNEDFFKIYDGMLYRSEDNKT